MRRPSNSPLWKLPVEEEVRSELEFHLEMRVRQYMDDGLDEAAARDLAEARLGDLDVLARDCNRLAAARDRRRGLGEIAEDLALDARLAIRQLAKSGSSLLAAVAALALGIGAVTAVFSAVYSVLLEPLPLDGADRLVSIETRDRKTGDVESLIAPIEFAAWRDSEVLEDVAAYMGDGFTVLVDDLPRRTFGLEVSPRFLDLARAPLREGRLLVPADFVSGAPDVVVVTAGFAQSIFGSSARAVGEDLTVDGAPHLVVGVLSDDIAVLNDDLDLILPLPWSARTETVEASYLLALGRLRPDSSRASATAALQPIQQRLEVRMDESVERDIALSPFRQTLVGDGGRRLILLFGAVGLVLLISCGNVANLLLARGLERRRELGVRTALGASRARLLRQLLTESFLIVASASALGLILAGSLLRVFVAGAPEALPGLDQARLNVPVLLFTLVLAVATTVVAGLLPALRTARLAEDVARGRSASKRTGRLRPVLVVGQVAMTLAMLLGAGLLLRGAVLESRVLPGFEQEGLVSAQLSLPQAKYRDLDSLVAAYASLLEEVRALPGIESAGLGNRVPLAGPSLGIEYAPKEDPSAGVLAALRIASPGLFETLKIPLVRGRTLSDQGAAERPIQVVVNQTFARSVWGSEDPIGRQLISENRSFQDASGAPLDLEVVGVVGDVRSNGLRSAVPGEVYVSMEQSPPDPWYWAGNSMMLVVRSSIADDSLVPQLRRAVATFDSSLPLFNVSTMNGRLARAAAVARFNTWLFSILGVTALVLACAGIYSLTAYVVSQQEFEMGVRLALGSTAEQLVRRVVLRSMIPVAGGVAVGLLLAAALSGLVRSELFGVDRLDPVVCVLGAGLLLVAGLVAALLPARRTSQIDPARVLGVQ